MKRQSSVLLSLRVGIRMLSLTYGIYFFLCKIFVSRLIRGSLARVKRACPLQQDYSPRARTLQNL